MVAGARSGVGVGVRRVLRGIGVLAGMCAVVTSLFPISAGASDGSSCRDVRFEALSISSELTGNSRQSQIELLIEEQGIELEAAKNPPYELYK